MALKYHPLYTKKSTGIKGNISIPSVLKSKFLNQREKKRLVFTKLSHGLIKHSCNLIEI